MAIAEARRAPGQQSVIAGARRAAALGGAYSGLQQILSDRYTRHYYGFKSHYPIEHFRSYTVEVIELISIGYVPAETMA